MLFFNKHYKEEFRRIERWAQLLGIPLFTIFSTLFIMDYPFSFELNIVLFHLVLSLIGVLAIWYSIRLIIFFLRERFGKVRFSIRLTVQLVLTMVVTLFIIWVLDIIGDKYFMDILCPHDEVVYFETKNLYLTAIVFAFLINTIYEIFYLMMRLSEKALESERYKKESVEAQYQNLTSRLNPHFLFNSLNTLTTIVEEDSKKAVNYIRELSVVYRYVLNSQKLTWADLAAEMSFTQSYMLLMKMRFEDNLRITLEICEEHLNYHILPMTVQLLIENAVKHNEISSSHPLEIKICCRDEKLIVSNNKQKRTIMPATTKVGLHNISERYRFLVNKAVVIEDREDSFTVQVPLIRNIEEDREHIEEYF